MLKKIGLLLQTSKRRFPDRGKQGSIQIASIPSSSRTGPMRLWNALLAVLALAAAPAVAQEQERSPNGEAVDLGDIEVLSERLLRERVQTFTREVTAPPLGRRMERPLARWDRAICVGVSNLDARYARFMIDRVVTIANELGVQTRAPGCKPNIMIVAAADADDLAAALIEDDIYSFRPALWAVSLGADALDRFKTTDAPVRWWHVSMPVMFDTGELAISVHDDLLYGSQGFHSFAMPVRDASRVRANTRQDLMRAIIIVDTSKVGTVGFGALSDYVAMVALAQMAPDAETSGFDTVLNLFNAGANRSAGLTQWDRDYLGALYAARRDYARPTQQTRAIADGVVARRSSTSD